MNAILIQAKFKFFFSIFDYKVINGRINPFSAGVYTEIAEINSMNS